MLQDFSQKITFLGGGNMAEAIITGLLANGLTPSQISVIDPNQEKLQNFAKKGLNIANASLIDSVKDVIVQADVVILAVKPQVIADVLAPLVSVWQNQLVISILAGVTLARLGEMLGENVRLVRAMPNTPAMIQQGATGVFANVCDADKVLTSNILSACGVVMWVETEELLHAVTAVSGSAPAYFFYIFEQMIKTGEMFGLTAEQAKQLAIQTAVGSANMALQSQDTPAILRQKVTSPNGTTHSAIGIFEEQQLGKTLQQAMQACVNRSIELSK